MVEFLIMRRLGFTLLEFLVGCALLGLIAGFAWPFTRTWMQKNHRDLLSAQILQVITYSKTQAVLSGSPLHLIPLSSADNWDTGVQLILGEDRQQVIYEWSWCFSDMHLTWHGFQSHNYLRFDHQTRKQALRIEIPGEKSWSN